MTEPKTSSDKKTQVLHVANTNTKATTLPCIITKTSEIDLLKDIQ